MKKLITIIAMVLVTSSIFSFMSYADDVNKLVMFWFPQNNEKMESSDAVKLNDGDPLGYVTTIRSYYGNTSNVFDYGGTVYARIYQTNYKINRTTLYTFTSNTVGGGHSYYSAAAYGQAHHLRAEMEIPGREYFGARQAFRWCP